jgi:cytidine deaminase
MMSIIFIALPLFLHNDIGKNPNIMGYNSKRTIKCQEGTIHAEMDAVRQLVDNQRIDDKKRRKMKFDLVVIRVNKIRQFRMSKPCTHCLDYIAFYLGVHAINYVYYSNEQGHITREKFKDLYQSEKRHIPHRKR